MSAKEISALKARLKPSDEILEEAWISLNKSLDDELTLLSTDPSSFVPETTFESIRSNGGRLEKETERSLKKRGIVIIRQVFTEEYAKEILELLQEYMKKNGEDFEDENTFYEIYWSKGEVFARQHPNMLLVTKALLRTWRTDPHTDGATNLDQPLMYIDRMRCRKPGEKKFILKPHLDSGSITRWSDPTYRKSYESIFRGAWQSHDPFLVNGRGAAVMDMHCSFFRAFQGWTALTPSGPGDGTMTILPILKESIAYLMLRPFLADVPPDSIPGYNLRTLLYADPNFHSKLTDAMISVPAVRPRDAVFWHPDLLHGVEERTTTWCCPSRLDPTAQLTGCM